MLQLGGEGDKRSPTLLFQCKISRTIKRNSRLTNTIPHGTNKLLRKKKSSPSPSKEEIGLRQKMNKLVEEGDREGAIEKKELATTKEVGEVAGGVDVVEADFIRNLPMQMGREGIKTRAVKIGDGTTIEEAVEDVEITVITTITTTTEVVTVVDINRREMKTMGKKIITTLHDQTETTTITMTTTKPAIMTNIITTLTVEITKNQNLLNSKHIQGRRKKRKAMCLCPRGESVGRSHPFIF